LIAAQHTAGERVRAPEQFGHVTEPALPQRRAHPGAAHDLGPDVDRRHGMDCEAEFAAQRAEERHIAAALVAEVKPLADGEAAQPAKTGHQVTDELLAGPLAEGGVEPQHQRGIDTELGDRGEPLAQGLEQSRSLVRMEHMERVRIEGGHHRARPQRPGVEQRLTDDVLMAEVDAVEHAQRQTHTGRTGRSGRVEHLHAVVTRSP
jgi:hypothetical protein